MIAAPALAYDFVCVFVSLGDHIVLHCIVLYWKSLNPRNVTTGPTLADKSNMTQLLNSSITAEEIKKAIQKLKWKKTAGVDGISAEFYKYGCNELLPAL